MLKRLNNPARDGSIDFLRALMALYVIGFLHLMSYTSAPVNIYDNWLVHAITKVALGTFIFLSGWLLAQWKDRLDWRGVMCFYRRRLFRIYPLYLAALIAFIPTWLISPYDAIKAALLISMFDPPPPMTLWFITVLMLFYCVAPLFIKADKRQFLALGLGMFAAMLATHSWFNPIDTRIIIYFPAFLVGIIMRRWIDYSKWHGRGNKILSLVALLTLPLHFANTGTPLIDDLLAIPWTISGSLLAWSLATRYCSILGNHPIIYWLSFSSYAAYLFHRVAFQLAIKLYWPAGSEYPYQIAYLALLIVPTIMVASWFIQFTYDRCQDAAVKILRL